MSTFKVNVVARNPQREETATKPLEALVDTGSKLTWLPADVLRAAGIAPRRKRLFATATQQKIEREVGHAILSAEGYETNDEVVFAEPGDMTLLGVRTGEGTTRGDWRNRPGRRKRRPLCVGTSTFQPPAQVPAA